MSILPVCVCVYAPRRVMCWRRQGEDNRTRNMWAVMWVLGSELGSSEERPGLLTIDPSLQSPQNILKTKRGLGGDSVSKEGSHQTWDVSWILGIHTVGGENGLLQVALCPLYIHATCIHSHIRINNQIWRRTGRIESIAVHLTADDSFLRTET